MAFGQIDPARLEGGALRRWYLRSPADIEEERRLASTRAYNSFFSQLTKGPTSGEHSQQQEGRSNDHLPVSREQLNEGRWEGGRDGEDAGSPSGQYQLAAAAPRGFWDYWGFRGCQNCHGYTPGTLPPYGGYSPSPPSYSPRSGDGSGGSGGSGDSARRGEWSDRPQCNQQFEADRRICQAAKSPRCWENQTKRLGYCSATGEVGTPPLKFGPPGT